MHGADRGGPARLLGRVSTYLGHATIQITLNLYGHLFPGNEAEAATMLDAYFARQAGGSAAAQTAAQPEEVAL